MSTTIKIISGGQTGADRAALDWAISRGIPHGGWFPKGPLAEDGLIADCYSLDESTSSSYPQRTEWNVRDSDGTVLGENLTGGSKKIAELAEKQKKAWLHLSGTKPIQQNAENLRAFLRRICYVFRGVQGQAPWKKYRSSAGCTGLAIPTASCGFQAQWTVTLITFAGM